MREDTTGTIGMLFQACGARVGVGGSTVLPGSYVVGVGMVVAVAVIGTAVGAIVLVAVGGSLWNCPHLGVAQAVRKTHAINNKRFLFGFIDISDAGWIVPRARSGVFPRPGLHGWRCW